MFQCLEVSENLRIYIRSGGRRKSARLQFDRFAVIALRLGLLRTDTREYRAQWIGFVGQPAGTPQKR